MATLRQYFDTDFNHAARFHVSFESDGKKIETSLFYDFSGYMVFLACYVQGENLPLEFYLKLLENLEYGKSHLTSEGKITLPSTRQFNGDLLVENTQPIDIKARFFGDPSWVSMNSLKSSTRVFIYSEHELSDEEIIKLKARATELGHEAQFISQKYVAIRTKMKVPLAFISHDSRDKDEVAGKIAITLQRMRCPVWYDEFTLKVGNNLRESIEKGLKECKKCILILSPNFFSNNGWAKKEFDSIFTREIIDERGLFNELCKLS